MPTTVNLTIGPNDKYRAVIEGRYPDGEGPAETESEHQDRHPAPGVAEQYVEIIENAPEPAEEGKDPDDLPTLTWDLFNVSSDPDLVAKMATYFTDMSPDEATERLRSKLRLLDCDVYAEAQIAARAELRDE